MQGSIQPVPLTTKMPQWENLILKGGGGTNIRAEGITNPSLTQAHLCDQGARRLPYILNKITEEGS